MTAKWQQDHSPEFQLAVNLSSREFRNPELVNFIEEALHQSGVSAGTMQLEITEGVLMRAHTYIDDALTALSKLGVGIVMDDFGTGYSSLSYLRNYPFDVIKVDRSFVSGIANDQADREVVNAVVAMAHGLNLEVVAEGIETEDQLAILKTLGCDYGQGFHFGKPMSGERMSGMLGSAATA